MKWHADLGYIECDYSFCGFLHSHSVSLGGNAGCQSAKLQGSEHESDGPAPLHIRQRQSMSSPLIVLDCASLLHLHPVIAS